MILEKIAYKSPANRLIAEIQAYADLLLENPSKYAIGDAYALEERI